MAPGGGKMFSDFIIVVFGLLNNVEHNPNLQIFIQIYEYPNLQMAIRYYSDIGRFGRDSLIRITFYDN